MSGGSEGWFCGVHPRADLKAGSEGCCCIGVDSVYSGSEL